MRDPRLTRSATACGHLRLAAALVSTSAQFATLIAVPAAIASMTMDEPSSSCMRAINAEASRTDAGSAFGNGGPSGLGLLFGPRFDAPLRDQLVRVGSTGS